MADPVQLRLVGERDWEQPVEVRTGSAPGDVTAPVLVSAEILAAAVGVALTSGIAPLPAILVFAVTLLVTRIACGAARPRLHLPLIGDLRAETAAPVGSLGVLLIFSTVTSGGIGPSDLVSIALVFMAVSLVVRATARAGLRRRRCGADGGRRTLIIGGGDEGLHIAQGLLERPELGLTPVGFLDERDVRSGLGLPLLGTQVGQLSEVIRAHDISTVVATFAGDDDALVDVMLTSTRLDTEFFIVPRLHELASDDARTEWVAGIPLVRYSSGVTSRFSWRIKRLMDCLVAASLLAFLAPVLVAAAVAVLLESGRPIFFRQRRIGTDGTNFELLKFRSMRPESETEQQTTWNIAQDPRVGPVGKFLRRSSIDELPQLLNILRGEMSLVGPRPERPAFVEMFSAEHSRYWARHRLPVGLTGWAQVNGLRGDTSIAERARFDNFYIANWSLGLDLKILLLTVREVLRGSGS